MIGLPAEMAAVFALTLAAGVLPAIHFLFRYVLSDGDERDAPERR